MISEILKNLKCFEDPDFKFDLKWHKYFYKGEPYTPVTKVLNLFHKEFDQEYWSKKKAEEAGINQEEILMKWKNKNDNSIFVGNSTHQWIENYFNGKYQKIPNNLEIIERINKFNLIYAQHLYKLNFIGSEIKVFSKKWKIAGTIDSLFLLRDKIYIVDWKTNGDFTNDDHPKGRFEKMLDPFSDYFKNHLNEYSIQISLY